ncbi:MAG: histone deacetylase family protein [bacterium]|nr:histone deacetylase family protein [bacterium]
MTSTHGSLLVYYDSRHALHTPPNEFLHGRLVPYLEMPQRIENIRNSLQASGLVTLVRANEQPTEAELLTVVEPALLAFLQESAREASAMAQREFALYHLDVDPNADDYYYHSVYPLSHMTVKRQPGARPYFVYDNTAPFGSKTWEAVLASASLAKAGARALLRGEAAVAYSLCRPPGHHAGRDFIGGYCYINNAALAASLLLERGKVAVIDVDYHHGNGTQAIFWDEPHVLFASIHADPLEEYPYYAGYADEIGGEGAEGTNLNMPLPMNVSAADFMTTLDHLLERVREFAPASIVISLGFDTYKADRMGTFNLEAAEYTEIARRITALGLPTLVIQEGGYNVEALGQLAVAFVRGLIRP